MSIGYLGVRSHFVSLHPYPCTSWCPICLACIHKGQFAALWLLPCFGTLLCDVTSEASPSSSTPLLRGAIYHSIKGMYIQPALKPPCGTLPEAEKELILHSKWELDIGTSVWLSLEINAQCTCRPCSLRLRLGSWTQEPGAGWRQVMLVPQNPALWMHLLTETHANQYIENGPPPRWPSLLKTSEFT